MENKDRKIEKKGNTEMGSAGVRNKMFCNKYFCFCLKV